MEIRESCDTKNKDAFVFQDGKIYFSRTTERRFYFLLTIVLAILGILAKTGLL